MLWSCGGGSRVGLHLDPWLFAGFGGSECLCWLPLLCSYIPAVAGTARLYPFCQRGNRGQGWRSGASQDMEVMGVLPSHPALGAGPFPEKGSGLQDRPGPHRRSHWGQVGSGGDLLFSSTQEPSWGRWGFWWGLGSFQRGSAWGGPWGGAREAGRTRPGHSAHRGLGERLGYGQGSEAPRGRSWSPPCCSARLCVDPLC